MARQEPKKAVTILPAEAWKFAPEPGKHHPNLWRGNGKRTCKKKQIPLKASSSDLICDECGYKMGGPNHEDGPHHKNKRRGWVPRKKDKDEENNG